MTTRGSQLDTRGLVIPPAAKRAFQLSHALWMADRWASRIAARMGTVSAVHAGAQLFGRFASTHPAHAWAGAISRRFTRYDAPASRDDMPLSPYVPPLRQISSARQGAANWDRADRGSPPTVSADALLNDLSFMNWGQPPEDS
jgi:hypothetical protein